MKKKVLLIIALSSIMCLLLSACDSSNNPTQSTIETNEETQRTMETVYVETDIKLDEILSVEQSASELKFVISDQSGLTKDAWLGICPDNEHSSEEEAMASSFYHVDAKEESKAFSFSFSKEELELMDGDYAIVICKNQVDQNIVLQCIVSKQDNDWSIKYETGIYEPVILGDEE